MISLATEDAAPIKTKKSKKPSETKPAKKADSSDQVTNKHDSSTITSAVSKKNSAASKNTNGLSNATEADTEHPAAKASKGEKVSKSASAKSSKKSAPEPIETNDEDQSEDEARVDEVSDEDDLEEDDQTLALIKGFESDGDEEDATKNGLEETQIVPTLPTGAPAMSKKQQKKLKQLAESGTTEEPGVVYIGRLPHGFYEHEMKAYFSQFGTILRLRLSRNKKTGASKHFAFIEFESATVAEIVAKTMDNYLMFNHILKVKQVPTAQVHADLFKGANKRFKKVPWNKIQGRRLEQAAPEAAWDKRVEREEQRREEKAGKLKAIGYEFTAPEIKNTKQISKKEKISTSGDPVDEPKAIAATPTKDDSSNGLEKNKKTTVAKAAKSSASTEPATIPTLDESGENESAPPAKSLSKPKKGKKSKTVELTKEEDAPIITDTPIDPKRKADDDVKATTAEGDSNIPEKKLRTKKSKNSMVDAPGASRKTRSKKSNN